MAKTPDFPEKIVYLGRLCELVGMYDDRAEYVREDNNEWRVTFTWDMFQYNAVNGLIEDRQG